MSYYAKPVPGHTPEEICDLLEGEEGIEALEVINGIVVVDTEEDPTLEVERIAFVTINVGHEPCGEDVAS